MGIIRVVKNVAEFLFLSDVGFTAARVDMEVGDGNISLPISGSGATRTEFIVTYYEGRSFKSIVCASKLEAVRKAKNFNAHVKDPRKRARWREVERDAVSFYFETSTASPKDPGTEACRRLEETMLAEAPAASMGSIDEALESLVMVPCSSGCVDIDTLLEHATPDTYIQDGSEDEFLRNVLRCPQEYAGGVVGTPDHDEAGNTRLPIVVKGVEKEIKTTSCWEPVVKFGDVLSAGQRLFRLGEVGDGDLPPEGLRAYREACVARGEEVPLSETKFQVAACACGNEDTIRDTVLPHACSRCGRTACRHYIDGRFVDNLCLEVPDEDCHQFLMAYRSYQKVFGTIKAGMLRQRKIKQQLRAGKAQVAGS